MLFLRPTRACLLCVAALSAPLAARAQQTPAPHLETRGAVTQLIVDGKPFLMLGGELRNSSSSSLDYMAPLWPRLAAYPLNTVLTPLSWEMTEPTEGHFDFTLLDGLLAQARAQHLHLVLLWLAAWKNGVSSYPPVWVKQDTQRFPRAIFHDSISNTLSTLTSNSSALRNADATAFAAVLRHLKQVDARDHTVLMMQVENEVGTLGDTRDHSPDANRAFAAAVPSQLTTYLASHKETLDPQLRELWLAQGARTSGSWSELFGPTPRADEIFMAWNYASYIQAVAAAGKAAYPLPLYVNAWLPGPGDAPGAYPSGGPLPRVIDIWKAAAGIDHAIDIYSPDLYAADFTAWASQYHRNSNPFFVPETNSGTPGAAWVFYAVGEQAALGFSPFAIDNAVTPRPTSAPNPLPDFIARQAQGNADLAASYAALLSVAPIVLDQQPLGLVHGFNLTRLHPLVTFPMAGYNVEVSLDQVFGHIADAGYGLLILTADDLHGHATFLGVGKGFRVVVTSLTPTQRIGFGPIEDGRFDHNHWIPGRRLNGDETDQGRSWRFDSWSLHTERASTYAF